MKTTIWALIATLFGLVGTAFAQNQKPAPGRNQVSASDQAATQAYWTVDRLANAQPMPLPSVDPGTASGPLAPTEPGHSSPGGFPTISINENAPLQTFEMQNHGENVIEQGFSYEYPFTNYRVAQVNEFPYSAVGKLFFVIPPGATEPAGDYVCSGSVMNNSYTVMTARHCMYDVNTEIWYNSWIFYPAYNGGANSHFGGGWTVRNAETWGTGSTYDYDIGFFQMYDHDGAGCNGSDGSPTIGSYTGWFGWYYGGSFTQRQWDVFGYPQASPFSGNKMFQDEAATGAVNPLGYNNVIEIGNPQTGGTSGGPWIIGLDPQGVTDPSPSNNSISGTNFVNGLNSFKWTSPNQPLAINGPEFESYNFSALLTDYNGISCP